MDAYRDEIRQRVIKADARLWLAGEYPPEVALALAPKIDDWSVFWVTPAVGRPQMRIEGTVSGDKKWEDGDRIRTSEIVLLDRRTRWARSGATLYVLGDHAGIEIPIEGWWTS